jgi:DNA-binding PadR family transcriptional regulator
MFIHEASRSHRRWHHPAHGAPGRPRSFDFDGPDPAGPFERLARGRGGHGMRRGEIRPLILATLQSRPMHGYEIIQELEAQSGGRWRPSAGSVYPTLQQLADEGLVTSEEVAGRRTYTLTDQGRDAAEAAPAPGQWKGFRGTGNLRLAGMQLVGAAAQVQKVGSEGAQREAQRILAEARRELYRLLADDAVDPAADQPATPTPDADEDGAAPA